MTNVNSHFVRSNNVLIYLVAINAGLLVASNAAGAKMINVWGFGAASATVFSYAITFAITDIISEVYGRKAANMAVRAGFLCAILSVLFYIIAIIAPAADFWKGQEAFESTLGHAPRILLGGFTAYLVSQHLDVWLFHAIKSVTGEKYLWARNIGSTLISQFVDTCIFITIAFYGTFPIYEAILGQYVIKVFIAFLDTPVVYAAAKFLRNHD